MSKDWYKDIEDFHKEVMKDDFQKKPHIPDAGLVSLRGKLIKEEYLETIDALNDLLLCSQLTEKTYIPTAKLAELADGIVDTIVVLLGTAITFGIDIRPIWDEIHKTNMAKKDGPLREDGKKLKPEGWVPPDVKSIIKYQLSREWAQKVCSHYWVNDETRDVERCSTTKCSICGLKDFWHDVPKE